MNNSEATSSWLEYWRTAMAESAVCIADPEPSRLKNYGRLSKQVFTSGHLKETTEDRWALTELFRNQPGSKSVVKATLFPLVYLRRKGRESLAPASPAILIPLCCPVWVDRHGQLYPACAPVIPASLLRPGNDEFSLTSAEKLNEYLLRNKPPCVPAGRIEGIVAMENQQAATKFWKKYNLYIRKMFSALCMSGADRGRLSMLYSSAAEAYLVADEQQDLSSTLFSVYERLLSQRTHGNLLRHFTSPPEKDYLASGPEPLSDLPLRKAHFSNSRPLGEPFRPALHAILNMQEGDILPVMTPPDSGCENLYMAAAASLWVRAAAEGSEPPLTIVSTRGEARTLSVLKAFEKNFERRNNDIFCQRWLPELRSYAGYFPDPSEEPDARAEHQTESFYRDLESPLDLDNAELYFLQKADLAYPDQELSSLQQVLELITGELKAGCDFLAQVQAAWEQFVSSGHNQEERDKHGNGLISEQITTFRKLEDERDEVEESLADMKRQESRRSFLLQVLNFLPPVREMQRKWRENFIREEFTPQAKELLQQEEDTEEAVHRWLEKRRQLINEHMETLNATKKALSKQDALAQGWLQFVAEHFSEASDPHNIREIDDILDRTVRYRLFYLASHYWEARWLLACAADQDTGAGDRASVMKRWKRRMMLTPCVVSPASALPEHMQFAMTPAGRSDYIKNEIDLLVIDHAEQIQPRHIAPLVAMASRLLVCGDEPGQREHMARIAYTDQHILHSTAMVSSPEQYRALRDGGLTVTDGNLMTLARTHSVYGGPAPEESALLLDVRNYGRSALLSFLNELSYGGRLRSSREDDGLPGIFPPFSYVHADGRAEQSPSGSFYNLTEASTLAAWLQQQKERLEDHYNRPLEEIVCVISPFRDQADAIREALQHHGTGNSSRPFTVGLAEELAEKRFPVVLFSYTWSRHCDGQPALDMRGILHQLVCMAGDSVMVFADMDCFCSVPAESAQGLMVRHLQKTGHGETVFAQDLRHDLLEEGKKPLILSSTSEHSAWVKKHLHIARGRVDIVTPFIHMPRLRDPGILDEMIKTVRKGIKINIYLSAPPASAGMPGARQLEDCCRLLAGAGMSVTVVSNVFSRLIIVDHKLMCIGSYHWSGDSIQPFEYSRVSVAYAGEPVEEEIAVQLKALGQRTVREYKS